MIKPVDPLGRDGAANEDGLERALSLGCVEFTEYPPDGVLGLLRQVLRVGLVFPVGRVCHTPQAGIETLTRSVGGL